MVQWANFPWETPLFANGDEAILTQALGAIENCTANQAGGMSRFPGLKPFVSHGGQRTYLKPWQNHLYSATNEGRLYRIDATGAVEDVTGVPISGGRRVSMDATDDRLVMAAGGPIMQFMGNRTAPLSDQAPFTTHVVYIDGYLLAIEAGSQRFTFCNPGEYTIWDPLNVFSANAKPENIIAAVVTPYRELMFAGPAHIEQYERLPNGTQPFSRRWTTGEGVAYADTLVADRSGTYGINPQLQFVRFAGQVSQDQGERVDQVFQSIDDWTDAWASALSVGGEHFIVLQMPMATNAHGTPGVTMLLDYKTRRWANLYGFDASLGMPTRYPAWSFARAWGRVFAGVSGGVAELDLKTFDLLGQPFPFLIRSGHVDKFGPSRIDDVRIRVKRGVGRRSARAPQIGMRVNRDQEGFDAWVWEPLGVEGESAATIRFGGMGSATTWQFEIKVSDPVDVQFVSMQIHVERLRW